MNGLGYVPVCSSSCCSKTAIYHFTGLLCSFLSNRSVYAGGFDRSQICKTVKSKKRDSGSKEHEMEVKPSECSFFNA